MSLTVDANHIYLREGNVYTSAGVTSALDLTLALIAEDHGAYAARHVARMLVTFLQRPGNQAQVSMFTEQAAQVLGSPIGEVDMGKNTSEEYITDRLQSMSDGASDLQTSLKRLGPHWAPRGHAGRGPLGS